MDKVREVFKSKTKSTMGVTGAAKVSQMHGLFKKHQSLLHENLRLRGVASVDSDPFPKRTKGKKK